MCQLDCELLDSEKKRAGRPIKRPNANPNRAKRPKARTPALSIHHPTLTRTIPNLSGHRNAAPLGAFHAHLFPIARSVTRSSLRKRTAALRSPSSSASCSSSNDKVTTVSSHRASLLFRRTPPRWPTCRVPSRRPMYSSAITELSDSPHSSNCWPSPAARDPCLSSLRTPGSHSLQMVSYRGKTPASDRTRCVSFAVAFPKSMGDRADGGLRAD